MQHSVIHSDCHRSVSHAVRAGFMSHEVNYSPPFGVGPKCRPALLLSVTLCSHFWLCFLLQWLISRLQAVVLRQARDVLKGKQKLRCSVLF